MAWMLTNHFQIRFKVFCTGRKTDNVNVWNYKSGQEFTVGDQTDPEVNLLQLFCQIKTVPCYTQICISILIDSCSSQTSSGMSL